MKILLTDASADLGPDTLVAFPGGRDASLTTLRGDHVACAFIAQAHSTDVEHVIEEMIAGPEGNADDRWDEVDDLLHDLSSMARSLLGYRDGSPVGVDARDRFLAGLDLSEASELLPDLTVGDPVVITAPSDRNLVNARGHVHSIVGRRVLVELDPGDRARLERSSGYEMGSAIVRVPRRWLESLERR